MQYMHNLITFILLRTNADRTGLALGKSVLTVITVYYF